MRIETYEFLGLCVAIAGGAAMTACSDSGSGAGAAGKTGGSAGSTATAGGGGGAGATGGGGTAGTGGSGMGGGGTAGPNDHLCTHAPLPPVPVTSPVISDFDNEAGLGVQAVAGPHGVWAMDVDGTPTGATGSFAVESCDTTGNGLHFKGSGFKMWGADVAAAFVSPTDPVDASKYQGISFVLKSAMPVSVIVKLTNVDSQPSTAGLGMGCGLCDPDPTDPKDCYSGFARVISSDATGTPQTIKWSDFPKQMWGFHFPGVGTVDPSSLEGISFSVDQSVASFDVCIDDVKFF